MDKEEPMLEQQEEQSMSGLDAEISASIDDRPMSGLDDEIPISIDMDSPPADSPDAKSSLAESSEARFPPMDLSRANPNTSFAENTNPIDSPLLEPNVTVSTGSEFSVTDISNIGGGDSDGRANIAIPPGVSDGDTPPLPGSMVVDNEGFSEGRPMSSLDDELLEDRPMSGMDEDMSVSSEDRPMSGLEDETPTSLGQRAVSRKRNIQHLKERLDAPNDESSSSDQSAQGSPSRRLDSRPLFKTAKRNKPSPTKPRESAQSSKPRESAQSSKTDLASSEESHAALLPDPTFSPVVPSEANCTPVDLSELRTSSAVPTEANSSPVDLSESKSSTAVSSEPKSSPKNSLEATHPPAVPSEANDPPADAAEAKSYPADPIETNSSSVELSEPMPSSAVPTEANGPPVDYSEPNSSTTDSSETIPSAANSSETRFPPADLSEASFPPAVPSEANDHPAGSSESKSSSADPTEAISSPVDLSVPKSSTADSSETISSPVNIAEPRPSPAVPIEANSSPVDLSEPRPSLAVSTEANSSPEDLSEPNSSIAGSSRAISSPPGSSRAMYPIADFSETRFSIAFRSEDNIYPVDLSMPSTSRAYSEPSVSNAYAERGRRVRVYASSSPYLNLFEERTLLDIDDDITTLITRSIMTLVFDREDEPLREDNEIVDTFNYFDLVSARLECTVHFTSQLPVVTRYRSYRQMYNLEVGVPRRPYIDGEPMVFYTRRGLQSAVVRYTVRPFEDMTVTLTRQLWNALENRNEQLAEFAVRHGCNPFLCLKPNWTSLHQSIIVGGLDLTRSLILKGLGVNRRDSPEGYTPLHIAAIWNRSDLARMLIEYGARSAKRDNNGRKPAQLARARKHYELARILSEEEADSTDDTSESS